MTSIADSTRLAESLRKLGDGGVAGLVAGHIETMSGLERRRRESRLGFGNLLAMANTRGKALAGVVGAAALAAFLLVPGLRLGVDRPWLGAVVLVVPVAVLLTATGYRHYGLVRAAAIAMAVTLAADAAGWAVAVFTLVKALSGEGVAPVWVILLSVTPAVSVLVLGELALRIVPPRSVHT